jgi:hydrogenase maturation protease
MEKIIILGVGNILLADEGFGVRVVEELLRHYRFPDHVEVIDGGTMGYELIRFLYGADKLILIDAIDGAGQPGTLYRFTGEEVKEYYRQKVSMHQLGIQEVLAMLEISNKQIAEVVVLGVQPVSLEMGFELSEPVLPQVTKVTEQVLAQLYDWGISIFPLSE